MCPALFLHPLDLWVLHKSCWLFSWGSECWTVLKQGRYCWQGAWGHDSRLGWWHTWQFRGSRGWVMCGGYYVVGPFQIFLSQSLVGGGGRKVWGGLIYCMWSQLEERAVIRENTAWLLLVLAYTFFLRIRRSSRHTAHACLFFKSWKVSKHKINHVCVPKIP